MNRPTSAVELKGLLLSGVATPEDLFDRTTDLKTQHKKYIRLVHPDVFHDEKAHDLTTELNKLLVRAELRIKHNVFGDRYAFDSPIVLELANEKISLVQQLTETHSFTVFVTSEKTLVYLTKNIKENKITDKFTSTTKALQYMPGLDYGAISSLRQPYKFVGKYQQRNIYSIQLNLGNYVPLRRLLNKGIPVIHLAWVVNRIVDLLHLLGITSNYSHTSLSPDTMLVDVESHRVIFIGLETALKNDSKFPSGRKLNKYSAPELTPGCTVNAEFDIYSASAIIKELVSPSWNSKEQNLVEPILDSVLNLSRAFRNKSAGQLKKQFEKAWLCLYGPSKFQNFSELKIKL